MQSATLKIVLSLVVAGVVGFSVFGHACTRRGYRALSLSVELDDRDGGLCRAGNRDLRAAVTYKEVI
jgi:hypothetical protein